MNFQHRHYGFALGLIVALAALMLVAPQPQPAEALLVHVGVDDPVLTEGQATMLMVFVQHDDGAPARADLTVRIGDCDERARLLVMATRADGTATAAIALPDHKPGYPVDIHVHASAGGQSGQAVASVLPWWGSATAGRTASTAP